MVPAIIGEIGPTSYFLLLLVVTVTMWGLFGTVLIRWSCSALNGIRVIYRSVLAERVQDGLERRALEEDEIVMAEFADEPHNTSFIKTPNFIRAFGMVVLNALVVGVAAIGVVSIKAAVESDGSNLHPAQVIGLIVGGMLIGLAILWINREALMTTWLNTAVVTVSYLLGTILLIFVVFSLLQVVASIA